MQSHAPVSVGTLKFPNIGSDIALFGHLEILHTLTGMGSAALADAVPYPGKGTRIFRKDKEILKICISGFR